MKRKTRLDILRGMREILRDRRKWGKRANYHNGRFCLNGAFNQMVVGSPWPNDNSNWQKRNKLRENLAKLMGIEKKGMMGFNDDSKTTHKDVLKAIQRGINKVKRELAKRRARG